MNGAMGQWMDGWTEEKIGEWREEGEVEEVGSSLHQPVSAGGVKNQCFRIMNMLIGTRGG